LDDGEVDLYLPCLILMVLVYLALIEVGKYWFYHAPKRYPVRRRDPHHRLHRRAARFTIWSHRSPNGSGRAGVAHGATV
jgi:hypothetical protein